MKVRRLDTAFSAIMSYYTVGQTFIAEDLRERHFAKYREYINVKNSQQILHRLWKKGWIKRMSKGVYALP